MRWVGHVLSYEAMINAYNVQLKKPRVRDQFGNTGVDVTKTLKSIPKE
jgi:hypothetical protein